jgi:U4/U6.U5 tri-snRNP-associated protein 2
MAGKAAVPDAATGQVRDVVERVPFLSLGLDLPPAPLYKDVMEKNIIPQASLSGLGTVHS